MKRNILNKIPRSVKASTSLFLATVVSKGISYLTTPFYTRLLTAEEYGQASVFLTWMNLLGIIAMFCLSYGVFNNGMMDYANQRNEYSYSMLVFSNLITILTFCVVLFIYCFFGTWFGLDLPLLFLMGVVYLFQPAYNFWTSRQRYELKYKAMVFWTVTSAILSPTIAIVCIYYFQDNRLYARLFGAEIPLIVLYAGFYIYLAIRAKGKVEVKYWKAAFLFNLPLIPHYLSTNLLGSSDKLMISRIVNDTATAHYSVAYSVASIASIIWSSINASLIPFTYERCKAKDYKSISMVTMPILTVIAILCILVIMLAPEVVTIMATKDYQKAVYVIPSVVGGVFFQVQYFIYANIVYYYKRSKYVMYASVSACLLNIVLNLIFIRKYEYIAAGYTTFVCYLLQAIMDYFAMKKVVAEPVYDMKYLGGLSLVVISVSLFSNLVYQMKIIRYAVALAIVVIATIYTKTRMLPTLEKLKMEDGL